MDSGAMRADLVNRVQNAVNDLRNEWVSAGVLAENIALEMSETPTGCRLDTSPSQRDS